LLLSGLALVPALHWLHTTQVERWIARLDRLPGPYDEYERADVLRCLARCPDDDARVAGAFVHELALVAAGSPPEPASGSGRTVYTPRPLYANEYDVVSVFRLIAPELERRKPAVTDAYLDALLGAYGRLTEAKQVEECVGLARGLGPEAVARLAARRTALPDARARRSALLLVCALGAGRPEDAADIVREIEAESPPPTEASIVNEALADGAGAIDVEFAPSTRHKAAQRALVALGKPAAPALVAALGSRSRAAVNLAASALVEIDRPTFLGAFETKLGEYEEVLVRAFFAENVLERDKLFRLNPTAAQEARAGGGEDPVPSAAEVAEAHRDLAEAHIFSYLVAEGLHALVKVRGDDRIDLCFMRALASRNEAVAKFCARELAARLSRDDFIDKLFQYLAKKETFAVREIEVYEKAIEGHGVPASAGIVRNLERLLERAEGKPEGVYWAAKVIALHCLANVGDAAAYGVLQKYVADSKSFRETTSRGSGPEEETLIPYADLCRKAAKMIAVRKGKPAPTSLGGTARAAPPPSPDGGAGPDDPNERRNRR
jgi:hypothetical protein